MLKTTTKRMIISAAQCDGVPVDLIQKAVAVLEGKRQKAAGFLPVSVTRRSRFTGGARPRFRLDH